MNLWIRSQNKEVLIKCESLHLESSNKDYVIYANQVCLIGKYSKEKALEVLNEIQEKIKQFNLRTDYMCENNIYNMPKE